jgi:excisionase family DNA binding protein
MEAYLTIRELAGILRLSEQTIQRYVLNREIPYLKIKKVIRFRPADIERWAERGGLKETVKQNKTLEGDLFADVEAGCSPAVASETKETGEGQA